MKLTASLTDFEFDIIEGIDGRNVPKKALSGVRQNPVDLFECHCSHTTLGLEGI